MSQEHSINLEQLNVPSNRCLIARKYETLNSVLARLMTAGGQNWWHLVVEWGGGECRAIRFAELALQVQLQPDKVLSPLSAFALPAAATIDRFSMDTRDALDRMRTEPFRMLVVTDNGRPVGVLAQTLRS